MKFLVLLILYSIISFVMAIDTKADTEARSSKVQVRLENTIKKLQAENKPAIYSADIGELDHDDKILTTMENELKSATTQADIDKFVKRVNDFLNFIETKIDRAEAKLAAGTTPAPKNY